MILAISVEVGWGPPWNHSGSQEGQFQFVIHDCPFPEFLPSENNPVVPKDERGSYYMILYILRMFVSTGNV